MRRWRLCVSAGVRQSLPATESVSSQREKSSYARPHRPNQNGALLFSINGPGKFRVALPRNGYEPIAKPVARVKILITGASGFIGGALWRSAQQRGHEALGVGRRTLLVPGYLARDLTERIESLDFRPDAVVHCAARSSPWGTRKEFELQNITATRNVIDFCDANGRPFLVHVSTSAVMYENRHQCGMSEETPLPAEPINRYAATKREAERLVEGYRGPHCIVRPRAVFGPDDTVVFPRIVRAARAGKLPRLDAGEPVIGDLIYIETLVDYLLRIVETRARGLYLLTNNEPVEIWEFLGAVFDRLGLPQPKRRVPVQRAMRLAGCVERIYRLLPFLGEPPVTRFGVSVFAYSKTFDVTKALRDLGPPRVSLREGVDRFIAWQATQP